MQDKRLIWQENHRKEVGDFRIFSVDAIQRKSDDGATNEFYSIKSTPWITVIPLIHEDGVDKFVMVRQFRHGAGKITQEFPAGMVDAGEDPKDAALRELAEECAYQAQSIVHIGRSNPNPALFDTTMHIFVAHDLNPLSKQSLDPDERIEIVHIPVNEVIDAMGYGEMDHALMIMALFWYQRYTSKN